MYKIVFLLSQNQNTIPLKPEKILVIGSNGQIGTELVYHLRGIFGADNVLATDIKEPGYDLLNSGPFSILNVLDTKSLEEIINWYKPTQIYLLAALLSAVGEQKPMRAWDLNMNGLLNVLEVAREKGISKVYWPSSIAVFGPNSPNENTPQYTTMDPNTVYGISKLAGERWCEYYHQKYGLDVRSLRYPGLISWKAEPGGGTTDYAVHIFYDAIRKGSYECFLAEDTVLPMMYMPDAIRATVSLMDAPSEQIKIRSSYNVGAIHFTPKQIAEEVKALVPNFKMSYATGDPRQAIANSWPKSIDDNAARTDWGWKHDFDLKTMSADMIVNLKEKLS